MNLLRELAPVQVFDLDISRFSSESEITTNFTDTLSPSFQLACFFLVLVY